MIIYLSASTQEWNPTKNGSTDEALMYDLRNRVYNLLKANTTGLTIYRNTDKDMSLSEIVAHSNSKKPTYHFSFHSNAGGGTGAEVLYVSTKGKAVATIWEKWLKKLDLGSRGIIKRTDLGELNQTTAVTALAEHFFHDRLSDITYYLANIDKYAEYDARAIAEVCGVTYKENTAGYLAALKVVSPSYYTVWDKHFKANSNLNWNGLFENWTKAAKEGKI